MESGASDYVTKPYNAPIVRHRVASIIRLREKSVMLNMFETDRLTGLLSRQFFYVYAEAELTRHPEQGYDVICTDVDNFKLTNEQHGSNVCDQLLVYISNWIKRLVGENGICGRLESDKFVVLMPHEERVKIESSKLQMESFYRDAPVTPFEMKIGIYENVERSLPMANMCDRAIMALTTIKRKYGRNVAVYDDKLRQELLREHALLDSMKAALHERQFVVYLQPKHCVKTGSIAGAEALVRWIHPQYGFISPGEFIPLLEHNGLITRLDEFIWEEVCRLLCRWKIEGRRLIPISVNVSRIDLMQPNLCDKLSDMVARYDVAPEMLHLEVTESAYTNNPQQIIGTVAELRSRGFKIEMDDFGSGYSSLNMLSELPIDVLKLDMAFMQQERLPGASKRSILRFILSLSKWLALPTVAEGVETKEEVERLRTLGCDFIQGYVYAKPMSIADFEVYMDDHTLHCEIGDVDVQARAAQQGARAVVYSEDDGMRERLLTALNEVCQVYRMEMGELALERMRNEIHGDRMVLLDLLPRE